MKIYDDAVLLPAHRPKSLIGRYLTRYGRYDNTGRPIGGWPIFTSVKSTLPIQPRRLRVEPTRTIERPTIYAGLIVGWFGHFIIESVPNLIAVAQAKKQYPDAAIIAHAWGRFDPDEFKVFCATHLNYFCGKLGLDPADLDFVFEPTRLRQLIVPDAPFLGKFSYAPWMMAEMDRIWPMPETLEKVYFSRSKLVRARVMDEPRIETLFERNGFRIIHPQDHDLDDQIAIARSADILAGPQGSALHWSLYAPRCRAVLSLGYPSLLQRAICRSRGQTYTELRGRTPKGAARRLRAVDEAAIQSALDKLG